MGALDSGLNATYFPAACEEAWPIDRKSHLADQIHRTIRWSSI
jgi:hypothetical protein